MVFQLNFYEKTIWNYWSQLIKVFSTRRVRQHFYPNNMDTLDNLVKEITNYRREAIEHVKQHNLTNFHQYATQEEREMHKKYLTDLREFTRTFSEHIMNNMTSHFIESVMNNERAYFQRIGQIIAIHNQKVQEEETTKALMLQDKKMRQEEARKLRKAQNEQNKIYEKQNPTPLRRSSRRTAGIRAPISGAKVDTILPDQNY